MLESLKSLWARWKVQISVVGGVVVVASAYGTCSYDPQVVSEAEVSGPTVETTETVPVSNTTTNTETTTDETTTETTSEETTGTNTTTE